MCVGVGVSIFFFVMLFAGIQKEEAKFSDIWKQLTIWPALLATCVYLIGHWLRGIRCSLILYPYKKLSFKHAMQLVWIGYAANNILPFRLGEFFRAYVLTKREQVDYGVSLSTLFIERILDGLAVFILLFCAALFADYNPYIEKLSWIAGMVFVGAFSVVVLARFAQNGFIKLVSLLCSLFPRSLGNKVEHFGHKLIEGTQCLQWDRRLPGILLLSLLIWVVEGGMFLLMLKAFNFPMSWVAAYLAMTITNLGALLPSAPSGMGVFHYFCTKGLMLSGVISVTAAGLSYALTIHVLQVVPITVLGLGALYTYGLNLRTLLSAKQDTDNQLT